MTPVMEYKDRVYWIAGKVQTKTEKSQYRYYIRNGKKSIESEEVFTSVVAANLAARAAIDLLTAVVEPPPKKPRSTTKRAKKTE